MKTKNDLKNFVALILWSLLPSVYLLVRMKIVSVSGVDLNILGQMEWFDLIDEIIVTTLTVPLYFILKPEKSDKYRNGSAVLLSFGIYLIFAVIMSFAVGNIAEYMQAEYSTRYLFLQNISMLTLFATTLMIMLFTINGNHIAILTATISRLILLAIGDAILIPRFGDAGASYSEIAVNLLVGVICIGYGLKTGLVAFGKIKTDFIKEWMTKGSFAGISIFLDNYIYAIMICKMVNAVSESGNYWVANNFIWGWLLVPVTCLVEIIRKNNLEKLTLKNTWIYMGGIYGLWLVTFPFWNTFLSKAMSVDAGTTMAIILPLIPFYLTYVVSAVMDAWFISKGKTSYIAITSFLVNIVYYGFVYLMFKRGMFEQNMTFIIMMFGFGMVTHLVISITLYIFELHKAKKVTSH